MSAGLCENLSSEYCKAALTDECGFRNVPVGLAALHMRHRIVGAVPVPIDARFCVARTLIAQLGARLAELNPLLDFTQQTFPAIAPRVALPADADLNFAAHSLAKRKEALEIAIASLPAEGWIDVAIQCRLLADLCQDSDGETSPYAGLAHNIVCSMLRLAEREGGLARDDYDGRDWLPPTRDPWIQDALWTETLRTYAAG